MDTLSPEKRRWNMGRVKGKNTKPELRLRALLHSLGFRFRLHRADLPGKPDIVLPKYRAAVFMHGCYRHRHEGCKRATTPSDNAEFWQKKFARTVERDEQNKADLEALGFHVLVVWECEIKNENALKEKLAAFLCGISAPPHE